MRVTQVLKYTILGATIFTTIGFLLGMICPGEVVSIFTKDDQLTKIAEEGFRYVVMFFLIVGLQMVIFNFF